MADQAEEECIALTLWEGVAILRVWGRGFGREEVDMCCAMCF